jgi:hypothetical protein
LLSSVPKRDENRSSEMRRVTAVDVPTLFD